MALLVNSHYKMPWIIFKRTESFSVSSGGYLSDRAVAHGLPFAPLFFGQWSDNASFSPSYDLAIQIPGGSTGGQPERMVNVSADNTNIYFTIMNNTTSTKVFYFRIMAFAPPSYKGDVTPVSYSSNFRFNSHYRYQQLYMQGQVEAGRSVAHSLGYLPQARLWTISGTRVAPGMGILTTNTLSSAMDQGFYYHIYKDEL